ncbi:MAG: hypothetical protein JO368_10150, partial [Acidimicrobiales bacterium]|nr:hypothetical protein [Acidimicrobiales bacterium]
MGIRTVGRVVAAAAVLAAGVVLTNDSHASASTPHLVAAHTSSQFNMTTPGFERVQSIKLATGAWTILAKATAVNFSSDDFVRCEVIDATDNVVLDSATTFVGSSSTFGNVITDIATLDVPSSTTLVVQQLCGHDTTAGNSAYLDPGSSLVGMLALAASDSNQSITRTTSQVALSTTPTTVMSVAPPTGAAAVGFKVTAVSFSSSTDVTCTLNGTRGYIGGTITTVGPGGPAAATAAYFTYQLYGDGTLYVSCSSS